MNSNMVKPEKFDHLNLVYHFPIPVMFLESAFGIFLRVIASQFSTQKIIDLVKRNIRWLN